MDAETLAAIRRLLADPDPSHQADAINVVLGCALNAASHAWRDAGGLPPRERLLVALGAISEAMEEVGLAPQEEDGRGRG
jgi:hypothetical protein